MTQQHRFNFVWKKGNLEVTKVLPRYFVSQRPNYDRNEYFPGLARNELLTNNTFVDSACGNLHTVRDPC